jgi:hypothetical protein
LISRIETPFIDQSHFSTENAAPALPWEERSVDFVAVGANGSRCHYRAIHIDYKTLWRLANVSDVEPVAIDDTAALYRKINLRLLPFLLVCYLFAYLDRVNIGFAKLQMQGDLGFSERPTAWAPASSSSATCCSNSEQPDAAARRRAQDIQPHLVLWGITSASMLFVRDVPTFYACASCWACSRPVSRRA